MKRVVLAITLAGVAAFQGATIREGHSWDDDFAQYVLHARNLATGQAYADTGYLVNPDNPSVGPAAYPPLAPVVLAPVWRAFDGALAPMKGAMLAALVLALGLVALVLAPRLSAAGAAVSIAAVGFSPIVRDMTDQIGADTLFFGLWWAAAGLTAAALSPRATGRRGLAIGLALGGVLLLAVAARTIGVALMPAVLAAALWRGRIARGVWIGCAAGGAAIVVALAAWPSGSGYAAELAATYSAGVPLRNAWFYARELRGLFTGALGAPWSMAVLALAGAAAIAGLRRTWRDRTFVALPFAAVYLVPVLLWPATQGLRYLLPVIPLFFFLGVAGVEGAIGPGRGRRFALAVMAALLAVTYAGGYAVRNFGPDSTGVTHPAFVEAARVVEHATAPDDRVIFVKPRALAWRTGRAATTYGLGEGARDPLVLARAVGATYVLVSRLPDADFSTDRTVLGPFVESRPDAFTEVFSNEAFSLYRILPGALEVAGAAPPGPPPQASGSRGPAGGPARIVFWVSLLLLVYTTVGYGALVRWLARLRPRPVRAAPVRPFVTVVVVASNEAEAIEARVANLLAQDYPADRLDVVVASDGSADETAARALACGPRVGVRAFAARRGKPAVLADVVPRVRGEIVVFADARQRFDPAAVTRLVECFADPDVGAATGALVLDPAAVGQAGADGVARYWAAETAIRRAEGAIDSVVGATGAIYAIRRHLFEPIPPDTVLDDVLIPLRIARRGWRVAFEPRALAFDRRASDGEEYTRKVRTIAGNFQLFAREPWLLHPLENRLWWQTVSHKALRLLLPALVVMLAGANAALLGDPFYRATALAWLAAVAAAAAAVWSPAVRARVPAASAAYGALFLCAITVVAFGRAVAGRQRVTWDRAAPTRS